jgi:hypothetical protein
MKTPIEKPKSSAVLKQEDKARIETIRSDIAGRLQKSCRHLTPAEFVTLVDKMTSVQIGGESRSR